MNNYHIQPFTKLWAISLHTTLSERVKGNIYVDTTTPILIVTVYSPLGTVFRYQIPNIEREIVLGLDSKMVTENIVKQYKKFINNQFLL